jgi:hypothetical protein
MLEDYLKRLESLITPETYSKANFRERIGVTSRGSDLTLPTKDIVLEDSKRLIDSYLNKMGIKELESKSYSENRLKAYGKILESEGKLEHPPDEQRVTRTGRMFSKDRVNSPEDSVAKVLSYSPNARDSEDVGMLKEKIHNLNLKNMNYRHEIETLKSTINGLNKELDDQNQLITKFERQKESDNKYLLKLESMLQHSKSSSLMSFKSSSNPNGAINDLSRITSTQTGFKNKRNTSFNDFFSVEFSKNNILIEEKGNNNILNLNDKEELRMLVLNLLTENKKLKDFQKEVFEISKSYDNINEGMMEAIKNLQCIMKDDQLVNLDDAQGKFELISKTNSNLDNFDKILQTIENTLELKNKEYNYLIETKDKEIVLFSNELVSIGIDLENMKKDRLRDQKIINDLESEIEYLNSRINELQEILEGDKNQVINGIFEQNKMIERIEVIVNLCRKKFNPQNSLYKKQSKRSKNNSIFKIKIM